MTRKRFSTEQIVPVLKQRESWNFIYTDFTVNAPIVVVQEVHEIVGIAKSPLDAVKGVAVQTLT